MDIDRRQRYILKTSTSRRGYPLQAAFCPQNDPSQALSPPTAMEEPKLQHAQSILLCNTTHCCHCRGRVLRSSLVMQSMASLVASQPNLYSASVRCALAEPSGRPAPMGQKTKYNDSFFDKTFMGVFTRKMEEFTGKTTELDGYEGLVDISRKVMQGRTPLEMQKAVRQVLLSTLPPGAPAQFKKIFPPTKWSCEINAFITVPAFKWLVGPCQIEDVELNGVRQKSLVKISKCRYLENSGCVGMCVNMCKLPTQQFFTNEFGLPLTMNPNFEDMSCEMIFGRMPPSLEDDPAFKQPCFKDICTMASPQSPVCPKLQPGLATD